MADLTAYFNGEWVAIEDVKIDYNDRGFRVGAVVFDVARTFNGKTFRMKEHVDRLYRSLKYARMDPGLSSEEMTELSEEVVRRNSTHCRGGRLRCSADGHSWSRLAGDHRGTAHRYSYGRGD